MSMFEELEKNNQVDNGSLVFNEIDNLTSEISSKLSDEINKINNMTSEEPINVYDNLLQKRIDLLIEFIEGKLNNRRNSYEEEILNSIKERYSIIKTHKTDDEKIELLESINSDLEVIFEKLRESSYFSL